MVNNECMIYKVLGIYDVQSIRDKNKIWGICHDIKLIILLFIDVVLPTTCTVCDGGQLFEQLIYQVKSNEGANMCQCLTVFSGNVLSHLLKAFKLNIYKDIPDTNYCH